MAQPMQPALITSSFLLSNLHCPSCVSHITNTLYTLNPRPTSVSPSLVTSLVTVRHAPSLSLVDICTALENAGFDICDVTSEGLDPGGVTGSSRTGSGVEIGYLERIIQKFTAGKECVSEDPKYTTRHLQNCESCRTEASGKHGLDTKSIASPVQKSTMTNSFEDEKTLLPLVVVDSDEHLEQIWRASVAIGGMTCAACAGTITEELEKKSWVKKVTVNLISNSATIDFVGEEHKTDLVENIDDIGFDAVIDSVVDIKALEQGPRGENIQRTVDIRIDGMFCEHCPEKIIGAVKGLGNQLKIEKALNQKDGILRVSYTPKVPDFTVRNIIAAIAAVDEGFKPSIYHPPTLEERSRQMHKREQFRILIRVLLTFAIAIPTLIIGIVYMSLVSKGDPGRKYLMSPLRAGVSRAQWALFILATPVYFLCADVFHTRAIKEIIYMWRPGSTTPFLQRFYRFGSMNMLMSLGTSIAYISSLAQLIAAGVHPSEMADDSAFYFDSVVFLTFFLLIGRLIESYSKSKTGDAITMLGKLRPSEALLVESVSVERNDTITGEELASAKSERVRTVNVDLLEFGDIVKVLHGASPPCDGTIVQGETKFDEASLTGESRLIKKSVGDEVYSGTVNKDTPVSIRITGIAGSSMLDQIVKAVREGQTRRAPMERIADNLTSVFVPFITFIAISTWIIWLGLGLSGTLPREYLGSETSWVVWSLQFAISVFVVACPCGLALAAPTALFVGGGLAAKYGILVKGGGEAFENASKLDCIVFDKTGTLTVGGEPVVTDFEILPMESSPEISSEIILGMIEAVESNSSHTIAKAIAAFCRTKDLQSSDLVTVEEIAGKGMKAAFLTPTNQEIEFIIGNERFLSDFDVSIPSTAAQTLTAWKNEGKSVALSAILPSKTAQWTLTTLLSISDPLRPETPSLIASLHSLGIEIYILSGDNAITANAIGAQLSIPSSHIIADVLPSQKADAIRSLQKSLPSKRRDKRALVAMIGDGINDSPALTAADIGISLITGSDIAISSAEFILVSPSLSSLLTLLSLSKFVFRRIKFNFVWALVYNLVAVPVAGGAFYALKSGGKHVRLDPVWASAAMALSSVSVVCSSLLIRSRVWGVGFREPVSKEIKEDGKGKGE